MIFEEALSLMRQGKKIRHPYWEKDVHLKGCYVLLKNWDEFGNPIPPSKEEIQEAQKGSMGIVKMDGEMQHDDMVSDAIKNKDPFFVPLCGNKDLHNYPQINLFYIMSDAWELYELEDKE